jgi:formylglycine-generating enzyme
MRRNHHFFKFPALFFLAAIIVASCGRQEVSETTGWRYNHEASGGFEVSEYREQALGPGLVLVEGGTFVMGRTVDDVMFDWNNIQRRVTVSSFYMDETEVTNLDYLEYLYWLNRVFRQGDDGRPHQVYLNALPDTLVWRDPLAYNEPFVENYLRHPAYHDYPVVGVSWVQAKDYADWRTDRVNEMLLVEEGYMEWDQREVTADNFFTTEAYLAGLYRSDAVTRRDLNPNNEERLIRQEDGIFLPRYRLPTEAEWEFAALGLKGNTIDERIVERRQYPWDGQHLRSAERKTRGTFLANFQRGRGDMMGVAGNLNDGGEITVPVKSSWPNDYGLYHMAGNVNEWVKDVYRPLSHEAVADFRPFRGNVFETIKDEDGSFLERDPETGRLIRRLDSPDETRQNYRRANNINYLDGDAMSQLEILGTELQEGEEGEEADVTSDTPLMYSYGETSLITDQTRVYKGGSWRDRAYWLNPGTRRYLDQYESANDIGFRCAMDRVGSPIGVNR